MVSLDEMEKVCQTRCINIAHVMSLCHVVFSPFGFLDFEQFLTVFT